MLKKSLLRFRKEILMNIIHFEGNLCREPTILYTQHGEIIANLTLASDEYVGKGKKETLFLDCLLLGSQAEEIGNNYIVGRQYKIDGRLMPDNYLDNKTSKLVRKIKLKVNYIEAGLLPKKYQEVRTIKKDAA